MALMTTNEINEALSQFIYHPGNQDDPISASKSELRTAISAVDTYMDSIQPTIRNTIPADIRAKLSAGQIRRLIKAIMITRYS